MYSANSVFDIFCLQTNKAYYLLSKVYADVIFCSKTVIHNVKNNEQEYKKKTIRRKSGEKLYQQKVKKIIVGLLFAVNISINANIVSL